MLLKIAVAGGRGSRRPDGRGDRRGRARTVSVARRRGARERGEARRGARARARARPRAARLPPRPRSEPAAPPAATNGGRIKAARSRAASPASAASSSRRCRGTGPEGRIVAEDVERAEAAPRAGARRRAPVASGEVESVPLTNIRKTIARRLTAAWTVPVFELTVSADMTRANALVERVARARPRRARHRHRPARRRSAPRRSRATPTSTSSSPTRRCCASRRANVGLAVAAPTGARRAR